MVTAELSMIIAGPITSMRWSQSSLNPGQVSLSTCPTPNEPYKYLCMPVQPHPGPFTRHPFLPTCDPLSLET